MPDFEVVLIDGLSAKFGPHVSSPVAFFALADFFLPGDQGVALDMTSAGVMFQEYGLTPVTSANQPVGLVLDKSQGLALGPESVTNGDFSNGGAGWEINDPTISVSGGGLNFTGTPNNKYARQFSASTSGKVCSVEMVVDSVTEGAIGFQFDFNIGENIRITSAGTYTYTLAQTPSYSGLYIVSYGVSTTAIVSSITIKVVSGNHASIATASLRPQYKTDGTLHWLEGDGVDDDLIVTLPASMVGPTLTIGVALKGLDAVVIQDTLTDPVMHLGPMLNYGPGFGVAAYFIIDRALSTEETSALQALLNARAGL